MTALQAYLVDLDGTLADTGYANYLAYAGALREAGIALSREAFDQVALGRNWREFLPGILQSHASLADAASIAARKVTLYQDNVCNIRFNEALVLLLSNRKPGIKAALVTSASAQNVNAVLDCRSELRHLFDTFITGDDVARHKPDPQGYAMAARRLGVAPANCVVFEDSEVGVMAGVAFGAPVLRIRL